MVTWKKSPMLCLTAQACTVSARRQVDPRSPKGTLVSCASGAGRCPRPPPPKGGGDPAPTVRLHEGLASCWPVLLTVRRLYDLSRGPAAGREWGGCVALNGKLFWFTSSLFVFTNAY